MLDLDTSEQMPAHLRNRITADAEKYFASVRDEKAESETAPTADDELQKTFTFEPKRSVWQWLGWAVAALAVIVLAFNIYTTQKKLDEMASKLANVPTPTPTKPALSPAQERQQLLASATDARQSNWGDFDPKNPKNIQGDVVWSNSAQKGFVRFTNLPVNDKTKGTYQVWIFDKDQKDPVSAGTFDISENGEVVVPIDSSLKIGDATMFGITAEKPGGVPKSDLKNVMAVAKMQV
jgi:hypothetical protein